MPRTVRAAIAFAQNQPLELRNVTLADPGPGQVLVRFLASGLCHSDLNVLEGKAGTNHRFPMILGHEGIGEVVEVGVGVTEFVSGDRVIPFLVPDCGECVFCRSGRTNFCVEFQRRMGATESVFSLDGEPLNTFVGIGSFAEMTVVPADMVVKVNPAAAPDQACCVACGVTTGLGAALITAKIFAGASVVVFGAGGVGLSVIQGARIAGASKIIAVDTNAAKRDVAVGLGATDFIDPRQVDAIVPHLVGLTGMGADFAFDCVGMGELAEQALLCVNPAWGMAVNVGVYAAGTELKAYPMTLMMGRRWTGTFMGGAKRQDVARYVDMLVNGEYSLDQLVSHRLKLEEINRGFDMMHSGEAVRSVVVYD